MRFVSLLILFLALPASAAPDGWRIFRDVDGIVRVMRTDRRDATTVPVARGGTPDGFLLIQRPDAWWLLVAHADRIVAGRANSPEGPYFDHKDRSLFGDGGTIVAGALPTDPTRKLKAWTPGDRADRLSTSDGIAPLIWPPDGFPIAGRFGTIDSWEKPCEHPWPFTGPWMHGSGFGRGTRILAATDGTFSSEPAGTTWKIADGVLTMSWPRRDAPDGLWVDRCRVSLDGKFYLGRNQWQAPIIGELVDSEHSLRPESRRLPLAMLPKEASAPEGKLSIWADFAHPGNGFVPVYVVNRTPKTLKLPAQDGGIYLKLEAKAPDGIWQRAEVHRWSRCGNSYFYMPELPPDRFVIVRGSSPKEGVQRPVRYRIVSDLPAISNVGSGRVSLEVMKHCTTDGMALREGDFDLVSSVALGEIVPMRRVQDGVDLRVCAVEQLARFRDDPRTMKVLRQLLLDPDPKVADAARDLIR